MEVRSVCLGLPQSLLIRFCHGIWVRDLGSIAIWWAIPRSVSEHLSFPSALIVFQKSRCITSNVRNKPPPRRAPHERGFPQLNQAALPLEACPFRKCHPARISIVRQNYRIIGADACSPAFPDSYSRLDSLNQHLTGNQRE